MDYIIFSDGACSGNPGPGGWAYYFWSLTDDFIFSEQGFEEKTTNNRMELRALLESLAALKKLRPQFQKKKLQIFCDSKYVLDGAKTWIWSWEKSGWKTASGADVQNRELWQECLQTLKSLAGLEIHWSYVAGHSGNWSNDFVDEKAVEAYQLKIQRKVVADGQRKTLPAFAPLNFEELTLEDLPSKAKKSKKSSAKALFYMSCVEGKIEKHQTWADCEKRVKGVSGARFQKVVKASDEEAILKSWGF